jgi:hypothetical protein
MMMMMKMKRRRRRRRIADSCRAEAGWNQFHPDPARKLSANLYDMYHC